MPSSGSEPADSPTDSSPDDSSYYSSSVSSREELKEELGVSSEGGTPSELEEEELTTHGTCWQRFNEKIEQGIERAFTAYAEFVIKHPWLLIVLALAFIIPGGVLSLITSNTVTDPATLWVPEGTRSSLEQTYFEDNFGRFYRVESIVIQGTENLIRPEVLLELYALSQQVEAVTSEVWETKWTFQDLCSRPSWDVPCVIQTPLDWWWDSSSESYDLAAMAQPEAELLDRVSHFGQTPLGNTIVQGNVLGNFTTDEDGQITAVHSMLFTWLLRNDGPYFRPDPRAQLPKVSPAFAWEQNFLELMAGYNASLFNLSYSAESSLQLVLADEINKDVPLVVLSYVLMLIFLILMFVRRSVVDMKSGIAFIGILALFGAILISFGISIVADLPFSPISQEVIPALILDVGVDAMIVFVNYFRQEYVRTSDKKSTRRREVKKAFIATMVACGPSTLLTMACNAVAFVLGAATGMPAMRWLAFQITLCIVLAWLVTVGAFSAFLYLDGLRQHSGRWDILFCIKKKAYTPRPNIDHFSKLIVVFYEKVVLRNRIVAAVIVLGGLVLCVAFSVYGLLGLRVGLGVTDVVPSDSYLYAFTEQRQNNFPDLGAPVYFVFGEMDYNTTQTQALLTAFEGRVRGRPWLQPAIISWWTDWRASLLLYEFCAGEPLLTSWNSSALLDGVTAPIEPRLYYACLREWLFYDTTIAPFHRWDLVLADESACIAATTLAEVDQHCRIIASRITAFSIGLSETSDYVSAITSVRDTVDNFTREYLGEDADSLATQGDVATIFPYSVFYVFFEQYLIILPETLRNVGLALLGIFVVMMLFLRDLTSPLISTFNVFLVVITSFGCMNYLGIDLNPISSSNIVMAIGLSVEFSSRVFHTYKHTPGSSQHEKVVGTMTIIGPSVILGALTTFVGFVPLAAAHYSLLQIYYFRMFSIVILFATFYSLFWLPAALLVLPHRCLKHF